MDEIEEGWRSRLQAEEVLSAGFKTRRVCHVGVMARVSERMRIQP